MTFSLHNIVYAHIVLGIWNSDIWRLYPYSKRARKNRLFYRANGIVCHDRILNNEHQRGLDE